MEETTEEFDSQSQSPKEETTEEFDSETQTPKELVYQDVLTLVSVFKGKDITITVTIILPR